MADAPDGIVASRSNDIRQWFIPYTRINSVNPTMYKRKTFSPVGGGPAGLKKRSNNN
jgi:hypothetical protein